MNQDVLCWEVYSLYILCFSVLAIYLSSLCSLDEPTKKDVYDKSCDALLFFQGRVRGLVWFQDHTRALEELWRLSTVAEPDDRETSRAGVRPFLPKVIFFDTRQMPTFPH
jgi:hypothetical protein